MRSRVCETKRVLLLSYDVLGVLLCAAALTFGFVRPAYAYVDPSVMTYAIQAFAGVAVALSAVLGVMWRRVRKKLLVLLQVDENAGKEAEGDVHRIDPACPVTAPNIVSSPALRRADKTEKTPQALGDLVWKARIVYAAIVAVFLVLTVLVVAPYELVAGGAGSLVLGLSDVWLPVAVAALAVAVCLAFALSLLRGRVFDIALLLLFAMGLCAYVQVMTMNASLPAADGRAVVWSDYTTMNVVSVLVWLVLVAGVLVLGHRKRLLTRLGAAVVSAFLIVVQAVGVVGLFVAPPAQADDALGSVGGEAIRVTQDGLFDVSPDQNVVVFVVDTFDTQQMQHLLADDPTLLDNMSDFTYFTNVTGSMTPTRYAVPFLLTGQLPQEGELFSQYLSERYARSTFLDDIAQAGYSVGVYSDTLGFEYLPAGEVEHLAGLTENLHTVAAPRIDQVGTVLTLWKCALYRDAPWPLKRFFWFYTDEVNNNMVEHAHGNKSDSADGKEVGDRSGADERQGEGVRDDGTRDDGTRDDGTRDDGTRDDGARVFTINDARYYSELNDRGLTVESQGAGAFRLIHLLGAHAPFSMNEEAQDVGIDHSTLDEQSLGMIRILDEYVQQLKDVGAYDNTTIIITADHGWWYSTMELQEPASPLLLVKPATNGDAASVMSGSTAGPRVSAAPVSHLDFQATVLDALGIAPTASATTTASATPAASTVSTASATSAANAETFRYAGYSLLPLARGESADAAGISDARPRIYYVTTSDGKHDQQIQEYEITGDALDFSTWRLTGIVWEAQS